MFYIFQIIHKIMKDKKERFHRIRHALALMFQRAGMRDVDSLVLSEMLLSNRPLSAQQLSERLNLSISGVTMALHRLMRIHLIKRTKQGKMYVYESDGSILGMFHTLLEDIYHHGIPNLKREIRNTIALCNEKEQTLLKDFETRVNEAEEYLRKALEIFREMSGGGINESGANS